MRASFIALFLFGCGGASASVATPTSLAHRAEELRWLEGRWQTNEEGATGETWAWTEGALSGAGYIVPPVDCAAPEPGAEAGCVGTPVETERLEIVERDGALLYVASPVDQARTEFMITELDAQHFVAENPLHDFPTRIEYQRVPGGLHVTVSSAERSFELSLLRQ
jgi:hypothetical protein